MPNFAGKDQTLNPQVKLVTGAQPRPGEPARPRVPVPEPPRGVKEAGKQVKCAAFYLKCYCLYEGCGPSAC